MVTVHRCGTVHMNSDFLFQDLNSENNRSKEEKEKEKEKRWSR